MRLIRGWRLICLIASFNEISFPDNTDEFSVSGYFAMIHRRQENKIIVRLYANISFHL